MRTDRELPGSPTVEFIVEPPAPSVGDEELAAANPSRDRVLMAAGLLVMGLLFATVGRDQDPPTSAPIPKPSIATPAKPVPEAHVGTGFAEWPSAAITKVFASDLPGSIVIWERTTLTNRGRELHTRTIRAVTGNVVLDIVVARPTGPLPSHATRIMQGSYAVTIRSTGFYPPTRKQLHHLAGDRRLTAIV